MKTAIMKNIITGVEKKVHLTKDHPAVQCGIAVWVDDEGKAYFPEDVPNPFDELRDIREECYGAHFVMDKNPQKSHKNDP